MLLYWFFLPLDIRIQKLLLRCMPRYFPHFGMKLSRACVKRTISATGVAENNNTLHSIILYVTFFASVLCEFPFREMDLLMMPSNCGNLRLVQWPLFLLTSKVWDILVEINVFFGWMNLLHIETFDLDAINLLVASSVDHVGKWLCFSL